MYTDPDIIQSQKLYDYLMYLVEWQQDPDRYNWIEIPINKEISFLKRRLNDENDENLVSITQLLEKYAHLKIKYHNHHPAHYLNGLEVKKKIVSEPKTVYNARNNKRPFGWQLPESDLHNGFIKLKTSNMIGCSYYSFSIRYTGIDPYSDYLTWFGTGMQLVKLHDWFIDQTAIPNHTDYIMRICENFCKLDGSPFNVQSLRSMNSRLTPELYEKFLNGLFNSQKSK